MKLLQFIAAAALQSVNGSGTKGSAVSEELVLSARADTAKVLGMTESRAEGLGSAEVEERLEKFGPNEVGKVKRSSLVLRFLSTTKNPLVILLAVLGAISYFTGDLRGTIVIVLMILLGVVLRFVQEEKADDAAEKLTSMISTTATVIREGEKREIPLKDIVPGDIVHLSAGDMVPADVRMLQAKDLFLNQAALTGESLPIEKTALSASGDIKNPFDFPCVCFMGSNVESGTGIAVVVQTGSRTFFGSIASSLSGRRQLTGFDKGVNKFTWLMIGFMAVMVPLVFLFNGLSKGNWIEAFLFALAIAVGLTPEMLPMIVTVNLSKGALAMAKKKVIVKRLNSIQNFGAMDVLCTDKTGTITQGRVVLERYLDIEGDPDEKILRFAYLNSFFQTGLKNLLDVAILNHASLETQFVSPRGFKKVDEIPFDFVRKRMSVVVEEGDQHLIICKGAAEEILSIARTVEVSGEISPLSDTKQDRISALVRSFNADGFRVIALGYRAVANGDLKSVYSVADEKDLTLLGFLAFLDPPKPSAREAIEALHGHSVAVKILTGDNELVSASICRQVGLDVGNILLGSNVEGMTDEELAEAADGAEIFAKLSPHHKERIIRALQSRGHVVGFMGDGINDAPALKAADVGISVDSAVDIAKESSDIILLENSLLVLEEGVLEGRKVFGNITKYIKMAASSNFGNMFSVLGGSIFLPFVPMLPLQVLLNNLLYDVSQTAIPTDSVDAEWLKVPRKWDIPEIRRFILFIGPISSIFDYLTYFLMLFVFQSWNNPALFHTGWFIESIFTQTLIIHVIRTNRIPFIQSRASTPLLLFSLLTVGAAALLIYSPIAGALGLVALPAIYWAFLAAMLIAYIALTQVVKTWFNRRFSTM
jgi:P-type Mg2+ transporter